MRLCLIGSGFKKDAAELKKLLTYTNDSKVLAILSQIKKNNKEALSQWLYTKQGVRLNTNAMFSIQSKRLHEYKRQQLNLLFLIHEYLEIKAGHIPATPLVSIFGAKAAPAYIIAKDIIHGLLTLSQVISEDPEVSKYLQLAFVENYNVSAAEKMIPACDLSEQISLASKEASGTGNMKFMLNGALTLGTMDGANVEIVEEVGEENAFIFGLSSDEVIEYEKNGGYNPRDIYNKDQDIRLVLTQLINGFYSPNDPNLFRELYNSLLDSNGGEKADQYFILKDFRSYEAAQKRVGEFYKDQEAWAKAAMLNTAKAGKFTSDRTIQEYVDDIWHLDKVTVEM